MSEDFPDDGAPPQPQIPRPEDNPAAQQANQHQITVAYQDGGEKPIVAGVPEQAAEQNSEPIHIASVDHSETGADYDLGENKPEREPDNLRSLEMATAEDKERTQAARHRQEAKWRQEEAADAERKGLRGRAEEIRQTSRSSLKEADLRDLKAERIGHWAGVLHDHPISEAFRQTHERVDFRADKLAYLEEVADRNLGAAADLEDLVTDMPPGQVLAGFDVEQTRSEMVEMDIELRNNLRMALTSVSRSIGNSRLTLENVMGLAYGTKKVPRAHMPEGAAKMLDRYDALLADDNTTLGQIHELYIQAFKDGITSHIRNQAYVVYDMLDDITNGRASESGR